MNGWDEGRLQSAVLVSPRRERRRDRRARKAAAASLITEDRDTRKAAGKAKADELAAERRATRVLPKAGEPGPAALRTPGRLRLPRHQDTSATLARIVESGKSALAKSLYTRSIPFGRRVYVPGDPKGEHTAVAEAVDGKAIALCHGMPNRLNPLDEGHRPAGVDDAQWLARVTARR